MDRVAAMLLHHLRRDQAPVVEASAVCPPFARRASRIAPDATDGAALLVDRLINRLWDYPRHVARLHGSFDVYHVVDHSYAQLVHRLPPRRTVVTCHDLDTFRSVLYPQQERRLAPFRAMTRHILNGLREAAFVTCDTAAVRNELLAHNLLPAERVRVVPIGVAAIYSSVADVEADQRAARLTGSKTDAIDILHVGSARPRKRIDVLLRACAGLARDIPAIRIVRVGAPFTAEQQELVRSLGLGDRVLVLDPLDERTLAATYRRAALVVLPSEREGFGLPLVEAIACGTPVVASSIPVLKEVGGAAVEYCPIGDIDCWTQTIKSLLNERRDCPEEWVRRRERGRIRARAFTWEQFAERMTGIYTQLAYGRDHAAARRTA